MTRQPSGINLLTMQLPAEVMARFGLPEEEALDAVEVAISKTLTRCFGVPVMVNTNGQIRITALHHNAQKDIRPEEISSKLRRHLEHNIELELQRRQVLREQNYLRQLRGKVVSGVISAIGNKGTLLVEMELEEIFSRLVLLGECPLKFQLPRERATYFVGCVMAWYITSVLPIQNSNSVRVRVRLSRTSMELPALLLREQSGIGGIRCLRRLPGKASWIVTEKRIPKPVINAVGKELREHLNVQVVPQQQVRHSQ